MSGAWRNLSRLAGALAACAWMACASAPGASPRPVTSELRPFLPTPARLAANGEAAWEALHERLLGGENPAVIESRARELAGGVDLPALRLLTAEARLVAGDPEAALADARSGTEWESQLVAGRAAEELGDPVEAVIAYRRASDASSAAAQRAEALQGEAAEALARRISDALARERPDPVGAMLSLLVELEPGRERTLDLQRRAALAQGDLAAERAAIDGLLRLHPDRTDLLLRRARLEVDGGDPGRGLAHLDELARRLPGDARVASEIARAKFLFRLSNVPPDVRRIAEQPQLDRADFARLLYWLVPDVRASRARVPAIATDLVDHPAREEILKVTALELLPVDRTLHLFDPDRPLRRRELFYALLARPGIGGPPACAADAIANGDLCRAAASCRLIQESGECLPAGPVSGGEAVDWIRRAIEVAEHGS